MAHLVAAGHAHVVRGHGSQASHVVLEGGHGGVDHAGGVALLSAELTHLTGARGKGRRHH